MSEEHSRKKRDPRACQKLPHPESGFAVPRLPSSAMFSSRRAWSSGCPGWLLQVQHSMYSMSLSGWLPIVTWEPGSAWRDALLASVSQPRAVRTSPRVESAKPLDRLPLISCIPEGSGELTHCRMRSVSRIPPDAGSLSMRPGFRSSTPGLRSLTPLGVAVRLATRPNRRAQG